MATIRTVFAKISGPTFGRMWRVTRRKSFEPSARERST